MNARTQDADDSLPTQAPRTLPRATPLSRPQSSRELVEHWTETHRALQAHVDLHTVERFGHLTRYVTLVVFDRDENRDFIAAGATWGEAYDNAAEQILLDPTLKELVGNSRD